VRCSVKPGILLIT